MKRIDGDYKYDYYLTDDGKVYNANKESYIKPYKGQMYHLQGNDGKIHKKGLKGLYNALYGKVWCNDNIVNLIDEEWKEIKGTNGRYFVSSKGRVKSLVGYNAVILKEYIDNNGYSKVTIVQDGERKCRLVSNLVGEAFILPYNEIPYGYELHHIKPNEKSNNSLDNLMYLSKEEHRKIHKELNKEKNDGRVCELSKPKENNTTQGKDR